MLREKRMRATTTPKPPSSRLTQTSASQSTHFGLQSAALALAEPSQTPASPVEQSTLLPRQGSVHSPIAPTLPSTSSGDLGTALPVKTEVMEEQPFFCDVEIPWVKPEVKNEEDFRPL